MRICEELLCRTYKNATIVPRGFTNVPGLYDADGVFVRHSGKRKYGTNIYTFDDGGLKEKNVDSIDMKVYYLGDLRCHYGHFLIDEASRLWGVLQENEGIRVAFFPTKNPLPKWLVEFFGFLGISESQLLLLEHPTRFTEVLFYEPAYIVGDYISRKYRSVFDTVARNAIGQAKLPQEVGESRKRLYLSRSWLRGGFLHSFGEKYIEAILRENGYEILHPERMTIAEQMAYYRNASIMITTNGTLALNVLYCLSDVQLAVLDRVRSDGINGHQQAIGFLFEKPARFVQCSAKKSDHVISYMGLTSDMRKMFEEYGIIIRHPALRKLEFAVEYIGYLAFLEMRKIWTLLKKSLT